MTAVRTVCPTYAWCTGTHENGHTLPLHRSTTIEIGQPRYRGSGQLIMWLESGAHGPVKVAFQAAHMTSATVSLPILQAGQVIQAVSDLLAQATLPPKAPHESLPVPTEGET